MPNDRSCRSGLSSGTGTQAGLLIGRFLPSLHRIEERKFSWPGLDPKRPSLKILATGKIWPKATSASSLPSLRKSTYPHSLPCQDYPHQGRSKSPKWHRNADRKRGWMLRGQCRQRPTLESDRPVFPSGPAICRAFSSAPLRYKTGIITNPTLYGCFEAYLL